MAERVVESKQNAKYDLVKEAEAVAWIEAVTGTKLEGGFQESLKSGVVLCNLINKLQPGSVRTISEPMMDFKMMESIHLFLDGCKAFGIPTHELFKTVDLYEGANMNQVLTCILAVKRKAEATGFNDQ